MKSRYTPLKNYVIAIGAVLLVVFLSLYLFKWYKVYQEEQTRESYLLKTNTVSMQITNIKDINTILSEAPSNYFVYIGYRNSTDVLSIEKKLKKVIDEYGINDSIYYVDITKEMDNDDYLTTLNSNLNLNGYSIKNIPAIIYFDNKDDLNKNDIIEFTNKKKVKADFENLLKENGIEKISR